MDIEKTDPIPETPAEPREPIVAVYQVRLTLRGHDVADPLVADVERACEVAIAEIAPGATVNARGERT